MARHPIPGTHLYTVDAKDETFGDVERVFMVASPSRHGLIVPLGSGYLAFAEGDHSATIGPEMSGGHRTRKDAAEAAVAMTERAPQVRAQILAQIAATA